MNSEEAEIEHITKQVVQELGWDISSVAALRTSYAGCVAEMADHLSGAPDDLVKKVKAILDNTEWVEIKAMCASSTQDAKTKKSLIKALNSVLLKCPKNKSNMVKAENDLAPL